MSEFRILDYNYVFDTSVGVSASSEDLNFPVSNLQNHLRSKVWRSSGYFVISSTNNKVDFNDGGGAVAATITSGNYSISTLITEIQTRMDAAGSLVHTVSYSESTGKWTISVPSGTFSLLWSSGANTATSIGATLGFDISADDTGSLSYTGASVAIHTEEWVQIDLRSTESIDSFALLFDALEGIKVSESATITLMANHTQNFSSPAVSTSLSIDSNFDVITHFYSSANAYRYWRIKIVDPANAYLYVEIPKVILSYATQLSQEPEKGFTEVITDQSDVQSNQYGHTYVDIYPNRKSFGFMYRFLTETDVQTLQLIYERVGRTVPICLALDATATLFDKDRFFAYGRMKKELEITHVFYNQFDVKMDLQEAI